MSKPRYFMPTVVSLLLALSGCAQAPNQSQFNSAYFGAPASQEECRRVAVQVIGDRLKDPESAQYTFRDCIKGWVSSVPVMGFPVEYGYLQRGTVNARNSMGGYTGAKEYYVIMVDGRPIRAAMADNDGYMLPWRPGPVAVSYSASELTAAPQQQLHPETVPPLAPSPASESFNGDDLFSAEKIARAQGCEIKEKLKDQSNVEIYSASCRDGGVLVVTCEWGSCKGL